MQGFVTFALGAVGVAGLVAAAPTYDPGADRALPYFGGAAPSLSPLAPEAVLAGVGGPVGWIEGHALVPPELCEFSSDCVDDYLAFPTLALEHASLISSDELYDAFAAAAAFGEGRLPPPATQAEMAALVRDALHVDFLLDQAETVPLQVTHLAATPRPGLEQHRLLLHDPWVGTFPARLLAPPGLDIMAGPPRGAILFLTGHLDTADTFIEELDGQGIVEAGYVVLVLEARADDAGPVEDLASRYLMLNGFTLMGLRAYEALLGLRLLQALPAVDPARVGLLGHSGGSSVVNALSRLSPPFAAAVMDHQGDHYSLGDERWVLCETVLDLVGYDDAISDPSTSPIPMRRVRYGWPDGAHEVLRFLDRYLSLNEGGSAP